MMLARACQEVRKPARVVVLGSGGFIGKRLVLACRNWGVSVVGIGSVEVDLTRPDAARELASRLRPQDVLVFLSALTPDKGRDAATMMRNLAMTRAVCEAAGLIQLAQLVYASSDTVYSFAPSLTTEETLPEPLILYGHMHRTREMVLAAEAKAPLAVLRFTAVYGTGDTHNSYGPNRFLRQALEEGRISLFGNGEETRDALFIDDAVALVVRVIASSFTGLLNLATGHSETFRTVAEMIADLVGGTVRIEPSPRQNPITHRHFDITRLIRTFADVYFTPLSDGLATLVKDARTPAHA